MSAGIAQRILAGLVGMALLIVLNIAALTYGWDHPAIVAPAIALDLVAVALAFWLSWRQSMRAEVEFERLANVQREQTDLVKAALADTEARYSAILESAMDAVITVDESQTILVFNAAAEIVFGCARNEAIGGPLERFIPERYRRNHHRHVESFGHTGVTNRRMGDTTVLLAVRTDGTEFPIEASISQTLAEGRRLFTVILRDVTLRKSAEDALRQSQAELRELSAEVLQAREDEKTHIARELHDELGVATARHRHADAGASGRPPARRCRPRASPSSPRTARAAPKRTPSPTCNSFTSGWIARTSPMPSTTFPASNPQHSSGRSATACASISSRIGRGIRRRNGAIARNFTSGPIPEDVFHDACRPEGQDRRLRRVRRSRFLHRHQVAHRARREASSRSRPTSPSRTRPTSTRSSKRMRACGAADYVAIPLHDMIAEAGIEVIQFQALYEGDYWNTTGIGRHVIVAGMVPEMAKRGIKVLGHGATGRGNDQVRFQLCTNMLDPTVSVYAPWRDRGVPGEVPRPLRDDRLLRTATSCRSRRRKDAPYSHRREPPRPHARGRASSNTSTTAAVVRHARHGRAAEGRAGHARSRDRAVRERPAGVDQRQEDAPPFEAIQRRTNSAASTPSASARTSSRTASSASRAAASTRRPAWNCSAPPTATCCNWCSTAAAANCSTSCRRSSRSRSTRATASTSRPTWPARRSSRSCTHGPAPSRVKLYKGRAYFESADDVPAQMYSEANASMEAIGEFDHADSEGFLRVLQVAPRALAANGQVTPPAWAK